MIQRRGEEGKGRTDKKSYLGPTSADARGSSDEEVSAFPVHEARENDDGHCW